MNSAVANAKAVKIVCFFSISGLHLSYGINGRSYNLQTILKQI